ncbi:uncharacterized protein LOC112597932 isoform X2 [Melanaphis sacchari]|uniref:uncharacterized protein LOC112597932 isoform X2 n=1 Tax=Melanaphis sacchari TaxID=742174 RepID=UPI000DC155F3|nr:uncharacterized protein LOC112597932 isoform X2 [Melanaphis sacchari]
MDQTHQFPTRRSAAGLGIAACKYAGSVDPDNVRCHADYVKLNKLPTECTALAYDGIKIDDKFLFRPTYFSRDLVDPENTLIEAQKLKELIKYYPATGLILRGIHYHYELDLDYNVPEDFYENLSNYVMSIKNEVPNLSIGLYLKAKSMIFYSNTSNSASPNWFDFEILNDVMDFYLFGFEQFNECDFTFLNGGITPLDSPDPMNPNINTLDKFGAALSNSIIPKEKIYLEYLINPSVNKKDEMNFLSCEVSYNEL